MKEFLSDAQREERLAFANAYVDRSQAWWNSVNFSDEKSSLKIISPFETEIIFGFVNFD